MNSELRAVEVPLTFQPELLTSGGFSDDVEGHELEKHPASEVEWSAPKLQTLAKNCKHKYRSLGWFCWIAGKKKIAPPMIQLEARNF